MSKGLKILLGLTIGLLLFIGTGFGGIHFFTDSYQVQTYTLLFLGLFSAFSISSLLHHFKILGKKAMFGMIALMILGSFLLLLLEVGLYVMSKSQEHFRLVHIFEMNEETGKHQLRKNYHEIFPTMFYPIHFQMNSHRMVSPEVEIKKKEGEYRVGVLGQSVAMGLFSSEMDSSFVGHLRSGLKEQQIEVLNFATPDAGLGRFLYDLRTKVAQFDVDELIVFHTPGMDARNSYLEEEIGYIVEKGRLRWKFDNIDQNARDEYASSKAQKNAYPSFELNKQGIENYIYSLNITNMIWQQSVYAPALLEWYADGRFENLSLEPVVSQSFLHKTYWTQENMPEFGLKQFERGTEHLNGIKAFCDSNDIQLTIIRVPFYDQVYCKEEITESFNANYPVYVKEFADSNNVAYFDLRPGMRAEALKATYPLFFHTDVGHFNNYGHRVAGKLIYDYWMSRESTDTVSTAVK